MSNSVDSDEMSHLIWIYVLELCLQKPMIIACGSERVDYILVTSLPFHCFGKHCIKGTALKEGRVTTADILF